MTAHHQGALVAAGVAVVVVEAADDGEPADVVVAQTAQGSALGGSEDVVAGHQGVLAPNRDGDDLGRGGRGRGRR